MLNLYLLFVNITSILIRPLVSPSFGSKNGSRKAISFCSLNSDSGIKSPSLFLLKYLVLIKLKTADKRFLVMRFTSKLKSLAILLILCNSLVMVLHLYLVRIFKDQCTWHYFWVIVNVSISHSRLMIYTSKNFEEFFWMVNFMFEWLEFSFDIRFAFLSFVNTCHLHVWGFISAKISSFILETQIPEKKYRDGSANWATMNLLFGPIVNWNTHSLVIFSGTFLSIDFLEKALIFFTKENSV